MSGESEGPQLAPALRDRIIVTRPSDAECEKLRHEMPVASVVHR